MTCIGWGSLHTILDGWMPSMNHNILTLIKNSSITSFHKIDKFRIPFTQTIEFRIHFARAIRFRIPFNGYQFNLNYVLESITRREEPLLWLKTALALDPSHRHSVDRCVVNGIFPPVPTKKIWSIIHNWLNYSFTTSNKNTTLCYVF